MIVENAAALRHWNGVRIYLDVARAMNQTAKIMMLMGLAVFLSGGLLWALSALGLGRLPGDFSWRSKHGAFHFPLASSIIVSLILTVILNLWLSRR